MSTVDKELLQKQLNKSTEILEMTFDMFNLQVIGYGFCGIREDNGWMELLVELALKPGERLEENVAIKANFYNEDGTIIFSCNNDIYFEDFSGYDTVHMYLSEDNLAFNMVKCRIYATRG